MQSNLKVKVLCGGISSERQVSLNSGKCVANALSKFYDTQLITLDKNALPANIDPKTDIIFPAMHGEFGEDGKLQKLLEKEGFSYAGSDSFSSQICMDKTISKQKFSDAGILVADGVSFDCKNKPTALQLQNQLGDQIVLKPSNQGSSVGLYLTKNLNELNCALNSIKEGSYLAEKFIKGDELSVGVLNSEAMGIVQIVPAKGVYDYQTKYFANDTKYLCPAPIEQDISQKIKEIAKIACKACFCRDFARVDFILSNSIFYILEINTLPGMTPHSLLPKSALSEGIDFDNLCKQMIDLAIKRKLC